jgi:hypothetical protein
VVAPSRRLWKPALNPAGEKARSRSTNRVVRLRMLTPSRDSADALNGSPSVPAARIRAPRSLSAAARLARFVVVRSGVDVDVDSRQPGPLQEGGVTADQDIGDVMSASTARMAAGLKLVTSVGRN